MRETWSKNPQKVIQEFKSIIKRRLKLAIYFKDGAPATTVASEIYKNEGKIFLALKKPKLWDGKREISFLLYKPPRQPIRGFNFIQTFETEDTIVSPLPPEIFQVQRRKFPRVDTPPQCTANFVIQGKTRVSICSVVDISMGGAKLSGRPAYELQPGDRIGPLTLKLCMKYATMEHEFTIASAKVARLTPQKDDSVELGIMFELSSKEKEQLESYINFRTMEVSAFAPADNG